MKYTTVNTVTDATIFESVSESFNLHIKLCLSNKISLRRANLRGADLQGVDLCGANLRRANLRGANLLGADLQGADLFGADLFGANLLGANLCGANLRGANLLGADLQGADLCGADLQGANLRRANLCGAALVIYGLTWAVCITKGHIRIGCECHILAEWESFDDDKISSMEPRALVFWKENKEFIITQCKKIV